MRRHALLVAGFVAFAGCRDAAPVAPTPPAPAPLEDNCAFIIPENQLAHHVGVNGASLTIPLITGPSCQWEVRDDITDTFYLGTPPNPYFTGPQSFTVTVPANPGPRRQGNFIIVGRATVMRTVPVQEIRQTMAIDQDGLVIPVPAAPSFLWFELHGLNGRSQLITTPLIVSSSSSAVTVSASGWTVRLNAPAGQVLAVGAYPDTDSTNGSPKASVGFSGPVLGACQHEYGQFTITELALRTVNGQRDPVLDGLHVTFERACGTFDYVKGEVWFRR